MSSNGEPQARHRKRKILIVDDHPIVRQGLAALINHEPDLEVCGGAEDVAQALQEVQRTRPDLIVVDISLKESHGIDLIKQMRTRDERIKMLVWSMFDEKLYAERSLRAGAMGYINKQESIDKVVDAIRQVLRGEIYLSSNMTTRLLHRVAGGTLLDRDPIQDLSDRELQVFDMIGRGLTTQQIARKLHLSPKTVETHREKIKTKLKLTNATQLSRQAVRWVLENG
jgi:DNA-binding NarL/FixJ family response regulator